MESKTSQSQSTLRLPSSLTAGQLRSRQASRRRTTYRTGPRLLAVDVLATAVGVSAYLLVGDAIAASSPVLVALTFAAATLGLLALSGAYRPSFHLDYFADARPIVAATALAAMGTTFFFLLFTAGDAELAEQELLLWAFTSAALLSGRAIVHVLERQRLARMDGRRTIIVGAGEIGHLAARRLAERPQFGLTPVGFLDNEPLEVERGTRLPVLGASWDLERVVDEHDIDHLVLTFSTAPHHVALSVLRRCHEMGVSVSLVPRLFEAMTDRTSLTRLGGLPVISMQPVDPKGWQFAVKYTLDRVLAALALALLFPVLLAVALAVRVRSGSPVLFRQERVGLDGRQFKMVKFRTMRQEGELPRPSAPGAEVWLERETAPGGVEGSDRRTALGAFLRRLSLDELPQLVNVLRGQMSLVGPRPERPSLASEFLEHVYRYDDRHRVKSGITGWAQIHGLRGQTSLRDRVEWDNYYIENWSLWLDLKILLMTPLAVLRDRAE